MKSEGIDINAFRGDGRYILDIDFIVKQVSGDFINCLEVGIWEEQ